jgi:hypothetical protein
VGGRAVRENANIRMLSLRVLSDSTLSSAATRATRATRLRSNSRAARRCEPGPATRQPHGRATAPLYRQAGAAAPLAMPPPVADAAASISRGMHVASFARPRSLPRRGREVSVPAAASHTGRTMRFADAFLHRLLRRQAQGASQELSAVVQMVRWVGKGVLVSARLGAADLVQGGLTRRPGYNRS